MPFNLKNLFSGGASGLIDSVKGVISEFHISPEDKLKLQQELQKATNEHIEKMADIAQREYDAELKDMQDSRNREIQISTSDKAPMINKIITPVLALLILGSTFLFWYIIIFVEINKEKEILISGVIGSLTTLSMGVVAYYFGSSIGSKANGDAMRKLIEKH